MDWYVVHTRIGCEQVAAARLVRAWPVEVYIPEVHGRRGGRLHAGPLFPGYLFVGPCGWGLGDDLPDAIDRTPGCGRVLRAGRTAQRVPCCVVEWLRCRVAAIDAAGGLPVGVLEGTGAGAGEPRRDNGPGAELEHALERALSGLLPPPLRVEALLHALGQAEPAEETCEPAVKRARRTRGQGRKIHYQR